MDRRIILTGANNGIGLAMTQAMLVSGFVNSLQLWMSYHFRFLMGKLMARLAEKARKSNPVVK